MVNQNKIATITCWIARISGSLILAFILFFVLAHVLGDDESGNGFQSTVEVITFLFFPISTLIGLSLALKWPGLGGLITMGGMIGLFIIRPELIRAIFIVIPIILGLLYTIYWLMIRNIKQP
ncbi:MAG: hypothetical protein ACJAQ4_001937 [Cryomorphaceae bacterium]